MDDFLQKIDRCASAIGSQYLYQLLHKYESYPEKLDRRYNEYRIFLNDQILREKIQKPMLRLNRSGACYIESILEFITLSEKSEGYIFLIDEIFRGANTCERLSSASAVLKHLSEKNINMVTTHDMELQSFLRDKHEIFHFMEQIENNEHFFDYLIKPGPCHSRNAIKLLELIGYPESIIKEALKLSKTDFFHLDSAE